MTEPIRCFLLEAVLLEPGARAATTSDHLPSTTPLVLSNAADTVTIRITGFKTFEGYAQMCRYLRRVGCRFPLSILLNNLVHSRTAESRITLCVPDVYRCRITLDAPSGCFPLPCF